MFEQAIGLEVEKLGEQNTEQSQALIALADLQLALVGGGIGNVTIA